MSEASFLCRRQAFYVVCIMYNVFGAACYTSCNHAWQFVYQCTNTDLSVCIFVVQSLDVRFCPIKVFTRIGTLTL